MIRVLLVEDDEEIRGRLELILTGESEMQVVGAFGDGESALKTLSALKPDVVLVDIGLPGMSGIELIRRIRAEYDHAEIMVHTVHSDHSTLFAAIKEGANSYLEKGVSPRELVESVQELAGGGSPMSPRIARMLMSTFREPAQDDRNHLTAAEHKVLLEINRGKSYKEVAAALSVSRNTVHSHIKKIYSKLQSSSRAEALHKARKKGLLD
tara:strand:- start:46 stop:675 length:630 start_codon:yes stop_codon:yes gene_type:complete